MVVHVWNFAGANAARKAIRDYCERHGLDRHKTSRALREVTREIVQGGSAGMAVWRGKSFARSVTPAGFGGAA